MTWSERRSRALGPRAAPSGRGSGWALATCLTLLGCDLPPVPGDLGEACGQGRACLKPFRCFADRCHHVGPAPCDRDVTEGRPCLTGLDGPCAAGQLRCTSPTEATCLADAALSSDICNDGLDNDCDGRIDEDPPGEPGRCAAIQSCSNAPQPEARTLARLPLRRTCIGRDCELTACDCGPEGRNVDAPCDPGEPVECGPPDRWRRFGCSSEPGAYVRASQCPAPTNSDPHGYAGPWLEWGFEIERPGAYALSLRRNGGACGLLAPPIPPTLHFALARPSGAMHAWTVNGPFSPDLRAPVSLLDCVALEAGPHHVYTYAYHPEGCPCGRTDCETAPLYMLWWLTLELL